jgi:hypothetical protein
VSGWLHGASFCCVWSAPPRSHTHPEPHTHPSSATHTHTHTHTHSHTHSHTHTHTLTHTHALTHAVHVQCIDLFLQIRGEDLEQQDPYVKLWESMNHVIAAIDLAPANGAIWVKVTPTHSPTHPLHPPPYPPTLFLLPRRRPLSFHRTHSLPPSLPHTPPCLDISLSVCPFHLPLPPKNNPSIPYVM